MIARDGTERLIANEEPISQRDLHIRDSAPIPVRLVERDGDEAG